MLVICLIIIVDIVVCTLKLGNFPLSTRYRFETRCEGIGRFMSLESTEQKRRADFSSVFETEKRPKIRRNDPAISHFGDFAGYQNLRLPPGLFSLESETLIKTAKSVVDQSFISLVCRWVSSFYVLDVDDG